MKTNVSTQSACISLRIAPSFLLASQAKSLVNKLQSTVRFNLAESTTLLTLMILSEACLDITYGTNGREHDLPSLIVLLLCLNQTTARVITTVSTKSLTELAVQRSKSLQISLLLVYSQIVR